MPVKMFLDGSGHHADSATMRLGSLVAPVEAWAPLEQRWNDLLKARDLNAMHFTDMWSKRGRLHHYGGMTEKSMYECFVAFANLIAECLYPSVRGFVCELDTKAYTAAATGCPDFPKPEQLCLDYCAGQRHILPPEDLGKKDVLEVAFDQDEPYLKGMHRIWQQHRKIGWPRQVSSVKPADSSQVLSIQAVDLMVGLASKRTVSERCDWIFNLFRPFVHIQSISTVDDVLKAAAQQRGASK